MLIMVIALVTFPVLLLLSKVTLIVPVSPGCFTSRGKIGIVHPQLAVALVITKSAFPAFLKIKAWVTFEPSVMLPKSKLVSVKTILGSFPSDVLLDEAGILTRLADILSVLLSVELFWRHENSAVSKHKEIKIEPIFFIDFQVYEV